MVRCIVRWALSDLAQLLLRACLIDVSLHEPGRAFFALVSILFFVLN